MALQRPGFLERGRANHRPKQEFKMQTKPSLPFLVKAFCTFDIGVPGIEAQSLKLEPCAPKPTAKLKHPKLYDSKASE